MREEARFGSGPDRLPAVRRAGAWAVRYPAGLLLETRPEEITVHDPGALTR